MESAAGDWPRRSHAAAELFITGQPTPASLQVIILVIHGKPLQVDHNLSFNLVAWTSETGRPPRLKI